MANPFKLLKSLKKSQRYSYELGHPTEIKKNLTNGLLIV
jgi:hypothetical protein